MKQAFVEQWESDAAAVHDIAVSKGWWKDDRNNGELLMLMVSELAEALEGLRHGNPASDHIPAFSLVEEELADVVIRIMDVAMARGWKVGDAIVAKIEFNRGREYMHGGKRF
jgi:NTP pyrophosphatase (non-canonical NTP hydrolase)